MSGSSSVRRLRNGSGEDVHENSPRRTTMRTGGPPVRASVVRPSARASGAGVGPGGGRSDFGNVAARRRRRWVGAMRRDDGNRDLNAGNFRGILDSTRRSSKEEGGASEQGDRLGCVLFSQRGRSRRSVGEHPKHIPGPNEPGKRAVARLEGEIGSSRRNCDPVSRYHRIISSS